MLASVTLVADAAEAVAWSPEINNLPNITSEVVETARESLVIGTL